MSSVVVLDRLRLIVRVFASLFCGGLLAIAAAGPALAGKPICSTYSGGSYCQYDGYVQSSYVNSGNGIILYFDTPFGSAGEVNIPGVTVLNACLLDGNGRMDFAKMFYASLLMAQASNRPITVQMFSNNGGYLVCDKIWVRNP